MKLYLIKARHIWQQRPTSGGAPEQGHRFAEAHIVVQLDEADEIAATAAAIAVEQVLDRVHQEAGFVIEVQRAQSHQPPARNAPRWLPTLGLQVVQQGNLLLDGIHSRPDHGEFASHCSVRPAADQSQARMVGADKKDGQRNPMVFRLPYRLSSRRHAQRRRVAGSGKRWGSLVCGTNCSQPLPWLTVASQACSRQRKLYWP